MIHKFPGFQLSAVAKKTCGIDNDVLAFDLRHFELFLNVENGCDFSRSAYADCIPGEPNGF
jgi:hypothetical protein